LEVVLVLSESGGRAERPLRPSRGRQVVKMWELLEVVEDGGKDAVLRLDPTILDQDHDEGLKERRRRLKETASHSRMDLVLQQQRELRLETPCLASHYNVTLESLLQPSLLYF